MRHICRQRKCSFNVKNVSSVIVKKPKGLLENRYLSCSICGKLFKNANNLDDHLENLKKIDIYHKLFFLNRISFEDDYKKYVQRDKDQIKIHDIPKFGKFKIKKLEKN